MASKASLWLVFAAAMLLEGPALACAGKNVLFADKFFETDPGWSTDAEIAIGGGLMKITARKGEQTIAWYDADEFQNADVCVDVARLTAGDAGAGIIFAGKDDDNFYELWINPTGYAGVNQMRNGNWLEPVPERPISIGNGAAVTLRLTLDGARAIAYVNGNKLAELKVDAPRDGGKLGLVGDSTDEADVVWAFSNFKITDLP